MARIAAEFLDSIRQAPPVDGVFFSLHGAMASEDELDPEGYLLAETRRLLGEEVPIVVSMDLHGIATKRMFEHADAIVAFHTYPHIDFFETGQRAARLLLRIVAGEVRPITARVPIPGPGGAGKRADYGDGSDPEGAGPRVGARDRPGGAVSWNFHRQPVHGRPGVAVLQFRGDRW